MKKLLFILLLTIPFIGFGQGWDVKLGPNFLTPFSNLSDLSNCEYCIPHKKTTGIGLHSSISYNFMFNNINPRISFSPLVSYSIINYHIEENSINWNMKKDVKDHYLNVSYSIGYKISNLISTKIGFSFDTQIKRKINGTIDLNTSTGVGMGDDPVLSNNTVSEIEINEFEIKGFSCVVSVDYNINPSFYIFTQVNIPVSIWDYEETNFGGKEFNNYIKKLTLQERQYLSIGIGYNIF